MRFKRGMRRVGIFLGVLGGIAGGFASYVRVSSLLEQRERHRKFEQLAAISVIQNEKKFLNTFQPLGFVPLHPSQDRAAFDAALNDAGIKEVYWTKTNDVDAIETLDGQFYEPEPAPSVWRYVLTITFPVIGFLIPWCLVSALVWIGSGFTE